LLSCKGLQTDLYQYNLHANLLAWGAAFAFWADIRRTGGRFLRTVNSGLPACRYGSCEAGQSGFGHESPKPHGYCLGGAR
jgi:hypothetical protein